MSFSFSSLKTYFSFYLLLAGIIRLRMIPTKVESATAPSENSSEEPRLNLSIPPPIPITRIIELIVRFLLSW